MTNFLGEQNATMDDKNRLTLPKRFRSKLDIDRKDGPFDIYILPGYEGADFSIMDRKSGEAWVAQFENLGFGPGRDSRARALLHLCSDATVDRAGRVLLPASLLERRGIEERDFVIAGAGNYLEVFSRKSWEARQAALSATDVDAMLNELHQAARPTNKETTSALEVSTSTSAG